MPRTLRMVSPPYREGRKIRARSEGLAAGFHAVLVEVAEDPGPVRQGDRSVGELLPQDPSVPAEKVRLDPRERRAAPARRIVSPNHRRHPARSATRAGLLQHEW